jgi:hypothetical protein
MLIVFHRQKHETCCLDVPSGQVNVQSFNVRQRLSLKSRILSSKPDLPIMGLSEPFRYSSAI